jgi:tripartite-type tricarboxylate transporter receptor subunit TctC
MKKIFLMALLAFNSFAHAQQYNILVGFPPGGGQHIIGIIVEEAITQLGQTATIISKPGAGGVIAMNECIKNADPKVLCLASQSQLAHANILEQNVVKYDPENLTYVKMIGESPLVLLTYVENTKSLSSILDNIKNDKVTFGSGALGNTFVTKNLIAHTQAKAAIDVPYKGVGPAIVDLMGKHIDYVIAPYTAAKKQIDNGTVRLVANLDDSIRIDNVPTIPMFAAPATRFGFVVSPLMDQQAVKNQTMILSKVMDSAVLKNKFSEQGIFIANKNLTGSDYKRLTLAERSSFLNKK